MIQTSSSSSSQPQLGILKTLDKITKPKQAAEIADQRSPSGICSRVTFSFEKLEIERAEDYDLDNEADREIEAIMSKDDKTPETVDNQVG